MGGLEDVGEGRFTEDGAALIVLLGILALPFAPILVELLREVGLCCPLQLVCGIFPVVQEFGLEKATEVHLGHEVFHLVVVSDHDPMVFTLELAPVQLARNCGDVCFWSVTPWREEVGLDCQLLLGGNDIPRTELSDHNYYSLVFVPCVVFLKFLDVLCVDRRYNGFDCHQVNHLLQTCITAT